MARSFSITPVRVLGLNDGLPWYDSRDYPVQFFPAGDSILITGKTVSFPDFNHSNAYGFVAGDTGGGVIKQSCSSYVSIPFQDWGPSDQPGISDDLADEVIGTIPGETDVAIVRLKGVRTNAPDQILGNTVPVAFEENVWVASDGGTMLVEYLFPIVRMVWIRFAASLNMDGTRNVILTRKQSIKKTIYGFWRANNSPLSTGWTYGGTNGRYGHIVKLIESKGPTIAVGGVITYRRGDGAQCSLTDTSDFSSTFSMDIEIIPGRSDIASEQTGGASGLGATSFVYTDTDNMNVQSGTHTYSDKYIGAIPENEDTRAVIVVVTSYISSQSAQRDINSVTCNGVAMTQLVKQGTYANVSGENDPTNITGIWIINAPAADGEEADIVINYNAAFWWSQIDVYAAYNLPSLTPVETLKSATGSVTHSLDTVPYGIMMGGLFNNDGLAADVSLTGPEVVVTEGIFITVPSSHSGKRIRGSQQNDSTSLSIVITDNTSGSGNVSSNAWASLPGVPGKAYVFSDTAALSNVNVAAATFNDLSISEEPAANNKRYVIAVFAINNIAAGGSGDIDMGTVTINGVAMTLLHKKRTTGTGRACIIAVYGLEVPTGTEADFVFNVTNRNIKECLVDIYTMYNLTSLTPVDVESVSAGTSHSGSINTGRYGFGIGLGMVYDLGFGTTDLTMTGFENTSELFVGTDQGWFIRTAGETSAGSQAISMTAYSGNNTVLWMTFN